ncbi:MAG: hypothetical protein AAFQ89_14525 [Cyanobacteria bacterium J06626_18]
MALPRRALAAFRTATPRSLHHAWIVCLGLLFSIGMHGLVLWLPVLPEPKPDATTPDAANDPKYSRPQESLPVTILPAQAPEPPVPEPQEVIQPAPETAPEFSQPIPSPAIEATPTPTPSPTPNIEATSEPPLPEETSPPEATPPEATPPETTPTPEKETEATPYADFPHPGSEQQACVNRDDCWLAPTDNWRSVSESITSDLEADGYQVELETEDGGTKIYTVSRDGEIEYYLNTVSILGGIAYSMTDQPLTQDELMLLAAQ